MTCKTLPIEIIKLGIKVFSEISFERIERTPTTKIARVKGIGINLFERLFKISSWHYVAVQIIHPYIQGKQ